jgi:SET domain-containing protein
MSEKTLKIEARRSSIHGLGVYVVESIRAGETIVEIVGERICSAESDRRYQEKDTEDGHTFMFYVDEDTVVDCGVNGNVSRYINHSCEPNCESVDDAGRIFLEALRDIEVGEELVYDYRLTWESSDDPEDLKVYLCRCGSASCRGTMLDVEPLAEAS